MDLFVNHCRLCRAEAVPTEDWPQLTQSGNEHLLEKIQACSGVQIRADDGLPKRICKRCETSLEQANTFRLQCQEADAWWRFNFEDSVFPSGAIASVYVKPEIVEQDELDGGEDESVEVKTVLKEEDSDYEAVKDDPSSDEWGEESSKKTKKAKSKNNYRIDFWCDQCSKGFYNKTNFGEHMARHSGVKNVQCTKCDSKFFCEVALKRHTNRLHTDNMRFHCAECDRKFSNRKELLKHQSVHSEADGRPISCELCPKTFKNKSNLTKHKQWVHQPEEVREELKKKSLRVHVCSYCGKLSNSISIHKKHLLTHTGEKNYECQICSKRFTAQWSHRKHMLIHTDERPYQCEYCQKAFRAKHHLTTHIRGVHTNERRYGCRFCPKAFVTKQSMQFHEKTHGEPVV